MVGTPESAARLDRLLLAGTICLASLVFWPVVVEGRLGAVLYREPRLAVIQVFGPLLALRLLRGVRRPLLSAAEAAGCRRAPVGPLLLFVGWGAATGLWARVGANWWHETWQLALLALLAVGLRIRAVADSRFVDATVAALVAGPAIATAIGLLQATGLEVPGLLPVSPELGVLHPSVMGYKNPMALALVGQLHLLAWLVHRSGTPGSRLARPVPRTLLALVLGLEILYLATLQSRASYLALAVTLPLAAGPFLRRLLDRGVRRAGVISALGLLALAVVAAAALPGTRDRLASVPRLVQTQLLALEGDRVTYLLNTLAMVREEPFGVGLGNWQVEYPVYRAHNRDVAFTETVQVRRAHDDWAQILGETGWTGLGLWAAVLFGGVVRSLQRAARADGEPRDRTFHWFLGVQLLAVVVVSAGDYFIDLPFHRLQLFLALALVALPSPARDDPEPRPGPVERGGRLLAAAALVLLGGTGVALFLKSDAAARVEVVWARLSRGGAVTPAPADLAAGTRAPGLRFLRLPGHEKTFHRTTLRLAWIAESLGERDLARSLAGRSLRLHPYFPNALATLASLARSEDRGSAARYTEAWDYVLHQATRGYRRPYPELPAPVSRRDLAAAWERATREAALPADPVRPLTASPSAARSTSPPGIRGSG